MRATLVFLISLTTFIILPNFQDAQNTFEKKYGTGQYEEFWESVVLSDTSIVHSGYTTTDAYIIRTNRFGDTLWARTVSDPGLDLLYSVKETSDNGIIVAGRSSSYGAGGMDIYLLKMNLAGQVLWRKAIGTPNHETANEIICCSDKGFLIVGYTRAPASAHNDAYIVKTDSLGNVIWNKILSGSDASNIYAAIELPNHDIVAAGLSTSSSIDVMLIKLDFAGNIKWRMNYGGSGDDRGHSVTAAPNGDLYVAGVFQNTYISLFKTDSMGTILWSKVYGYSGVNQWAYSMNTTSDGNLIVGGYQSVQGMGSDYLLMKTDTYGDTLWTRNYGFNSAEYGQNVVEFPGGGFLMTGYSEKASGDFDLYVVKTDVLGQTSCSTRSASLQVSPFIPGASIINMTITSNAIVTLAPFNAMSIGTIATICETCSQPLPPTDATPFANKTICSTTSAMLSASGTGSLRWYSSASSTLVLGTGTNFITPPLNSGIYTYYVEAYTCKSSVARIAITVTVSNCTEIQNVSAFPKMAAIYPNPFKTFAIVELGYSILNAEFNVYDVLGRKVSIHQDVSNGKIMLQRGGLSAGIYYYEVKQDMKSISAGKFVISD